ncbi:MAG: spore protease YyaC [Clostridia bacterium]|nr:spore protease YyaC [Clostridia bacterium]
MNELDFCPETIVNYFSSSPRPVILCIGTDRVCGDALGPLVGTLLSTTMSVNSFVYGTLKFPVTALNLADAVRFIKSKHPRSPILAIDACVGKTADIGKIRLFNGGIKPGLATGKTLPAVGDLSITATVACSGADNSLFKVSLSLIYDLAHSIATTVAGAFNLIN